MVPQQKQILIFINGHNKLNSFQKNLHDTLPHLGITPKTIGPNKWKQDQIPIGDT